MLYLDVSLSLEGVWGRQEEMNSVVLHKLQCSQVGGTDLLHYSAVKVFHCLSKNHSVIKPSL